MKSIQYLCFLFICFGNFQSASAAEGVRVVNGALISSALGSSSAPASSNQKTQSESPTRSGLPRCDQVKEKRLYSGSQCETSNESIFTRIDRRGFGIAWRSPTGLVWSQAFKPATKFAARTRCEDLFGRLPSLEELNEAYEQGIADLVHSQDEFIWAGDTRSGGPFPWEFDSDYTYQFSSNKTDVTGTYNGEKRYFYCVKE